VLDLAPGTLEAFGLYLVRTTAMVMSAPLLGLSTGLSAAKTGLIAGVAMLLFATTGGPLDVQPDAVTFVAMALRELLIGFFLGFVLQLFLLSVRVAGELVGHEMGFAMSRQVDPATGVPMPLITRVYETFFMLALLMMDAHHLLLRALDESFARAPVGALALGAGVPGTVKSLFGEMFGAGLTFAAPVMVLMLLVSILMGLLARTVPHLNVLEIGFTVRIAVGLLSIFTFAPLLAPVVRRMSDGLVVWMDRAVLAIGA
jgi:flagellar biosynthetic protein FliR